MNQDMDKASPTIERQIPSSDQDTNAKAELPLQGLRILLVSAFFESAMPSLREHQYTKALSKAGADVTLWTTTGSNVWKYNFAKIKPTNPESMDAARVSEYRFNLVRHRLFLRYSDFFFVPFNLFAIRKFDVVHVIEFRQGWTAMVAFFAWLWGIPVLYDHEQRADRDRTVLHRIDSNIRRMFIRFGSQFVRHVRHTVVSNRDHFLSCSKHRPPMTLAPLGADETAFFPSPALREAKRVELGVKPDEKLALFSGKISRLKKAEEVIEAAVQSGWKIVLVGRVEQIVEPLLSKYTDQIIRVGWQSPDGLNAFYNSADAVIFTNFSVSYWEAALAGATVLVPKTRFSKAYIQDHAAFILFGEEEMFKVEEELYHPGFSIVEAVKHALDEVNSKDRKEASRDRFGWNSRGADLAQFYKEFKDL